MYNKCLKNIKKKLKVRLYNFIFMKYLVCFFIKRENKETIEN